MVVMVAETLVNNELVKVGWLSESDRGTFGEKVTEGRLVRKSRIDGSEERIWKPSLRICLRW